MTKFQSILSISYKTYRTDLDNGVDAGIAWSAHKARMAAASC